MPIDISYPPKTEKIAAQTAPATPSFPSAPVAQPDQAVPPQLAQDIQVVTHDAFVTRVWLFDLTNLSVHFSAWIQSIMKMRVDTPEPAGRSNRQGWNSAQTIFANSAFAPLRLVCEAAFNHAFREMHAPTGMVFGLQAWANVHDSGGYNTVHLHENALLSATFYLAAPEGSGPLVFRDPRPGAVLSRFRGDGANNYQAVVVRPKPGTLVVFPNWLEHSVEPHEGPNVRISVAMNALAG